jgi:hypothetical protein
MLMTDDTHRGLPGRSMRGRRFDYRPRLEGHMQATLLLPLGFLVG